MEGLFQLTLELRTHLGLVDYKPALQKCQQQIAQKGLFLWNKYFASLPDNK